ncbi:unnamed protein product [Pleuronectes platessa]|uniref:Uncharacterized protein n=1 Tax=Pleuronectes platessa TaxID=8262 RepID=A0A9N7V5N6_PLEPL|nr:unnamed protein product [Pleuronectes platessa]
MRGMREERRRRRKRREGKAADGEMEVKRTEAGQLFVTLAAVDQILPQCEYPRQRSSFLQLPADEWTQGAQVEENYMKQELHRNRETTAAGTPPPVCEEDDEHLLQQNAAVTPWSWKQWIQNNHLCGSSSSIGIEQVERRWPRKETAGEDIRHPQSRCQCTPPDIVSLGGRGANGRPHLGTFVSSPPLLSSPQLSFQPSPFIRLSLTGSEFVTFTPLSTP